MLLKLDVARPHIEGAIIMLTAALKFNRLDLVTRAEFKLLDARMLLK